MRGWIAVVMLASVIVLAAVPVADGSASFTASTEDGRTYTFTASSDDAEWRFTDGGVGYGKTVTHTFGSGVWSVLCDIKSVVAGQKIEVYDSEPVTSAVVGEEYRCCLQGIEFMHAVGVDGSDPSWLNYDFDSEAICGIPSEPGQYVVHCYESVQSWLPKSSYHITVTGEGTVVPGDDDETTDGLSIEVWADGSVLRAEASEDISMVMRYWYVYDSSGQNIRTSNNLSLSVELPNGTYYVRLIAGGETAEGSCVINHTEPVPIPEPTPEPDYNVLMVICIAAAVLLTILIWRLW